jgi:hypothetical protein
MVHLHLRQILGYLTLAAALRGTVKAHLIKNSPFVRPPDTVVHVHLSGATTTFDCGVPASGELYQFSDLPCRYNSAINIDKVAITDDIRCLLRGADTNITLGQGFPLSTTMDTPRSFVQVRCGIPIEIE